MNQVFKKLALCAAVSMMPFAANAVPGEYTPVTDERLKNPEESNWLIYRGNYASWGYSPLAQVTDKNVKDLELAWAYTTGQKEGHQAPPIVNNGYMYVTTPGNRVIALDAKTGDELWSYKKQLPAELLQLHPTNRGVALYGDKVYMATVDCHVVALDAVTGKEVFSQPVCDSSALEYMTLAPLAADGKIIVGVSGGETGVRGSIIAVDPATGDKVWQTYTVPAPGEEGSETWPEGDAYKNGGGSAWITGSYDPETKITYWGTGNPAPWPTEGRPGDNLYTTSTIAMDVATGEIIGHHQYTPNDAWDWDEVSAPLLIDTEVKGRKGKTKTLVHAARNGHLYVLERDQKGEDSIGFVDAYPFVYQNVFESIDPDTGRPTYKDERTPGLGKGDVEFCPSLWGGKDWPPEAYNPKTGLLYIPAMDNLCAELPEPDPVEYRKGDLYIGYPLSSILAGMRWRDGKEPDSIGEVQAWNLKTGQQVWAHEFEGINWGPLLTTGGNLVFSGGTTDRKFRAFNASNGDLLWETATPSGVTGVPSSFEVDGEQYIAVQSGWGVDSERMQGNINRLRGEKTVVPQGGTVMVYKLKK